MNLENFNNLSHFDNQDLKKNLLNRLLNCGDLKDKLARIF